MSTTTMNIRIDENLKKNAEELFAYFGLNMSAAVNMFIRQAVRTQSIPLELKRYNAETERAFEEARAIARGDVKAKIYSSASEMLADIEED